MDANTPAELEALGRRAADAAAWIRACLGRHDWDDALAAARGRQADLAALCARVGDLPTRDARALLERALRDGAALEPEVARARSHLQRQLHEASLRTRAASQYRVLGPPRPRG